MKRIAIAVLVCVTGAAAAHGQPAKSAARCAGLSNLALPHTAISKAELIEAGKLPPPSAPPDAPANAPPDPVFSKLPAMCRVTAEAHPSADSAIPIEVWLPVEGWNGKFLGVGNGGFAGSIGYHRLAVNLLSGYATAGTDTGHQASGIDAAWALGHPEKIADFGWRGIHELTLTGEALTRAFYGRPAAHRYFASCSDGGREALMEAQRFPADYDGILAGAPAYQWTHLVSGGLFAVQAFEGKPESYIPEAKLPAISRAVLAQCGKRGETFLDDPRQCRFDPSVMLCHGADSDRCLTAPQLAALKALYAGARKKDGTRIEYGLMPGAELGDGGWKTWITGPAPQKSASWGFVTGYFDDMVYGQASLEVLTLDPEAAYDRAVGRTGHDLDATDPDLSALASRGGKLILYHGWNDPAIPALGTLDYYNSVVDKAGENGAAAFVRLFMVPGMQHCAGGPGATDFGQGGPGENPARNVPDESIYRALEDWVENGTAPERVIARHAGEQDGKRKAMFSRPICAYPAAAEYSGTGDRNSAASYVCATRK